MAKCQIVGRTRTNQPVEMTDEFFAGVRGVADYAIEHGENLDASFKTLETTGNTSVGGALSVTGNAVLPEINGETNPSVKPIYCHPVKILRYGSVEGAIFSLTFLIFNNDDTPFTLATFKQWVIDLADALSSNVGQNRIASLLCSGYYNNNEVSPAIVQSTSYLYAIKTGENAYEFGVDGGNVGGTNIATIATNDIDVLLPTTNITFHDGVNKIN